MHLQPPLQVKLIPLSMQTQADAWNSTLIFTAAYSCLKSEESHSDAATKPTATNLLYGLQIPTCTQITIYLLSIINNMVLKTLIKHLDYTAFKSGKVPSNNVTWTWQRAIPKQRWDTVKGARWACVCVLEQFCVGRSTGLHPQNTTWYWYLQSFFLPDETKCGHADWTRNLLT